MISMTDLKDKLGNISNDELILDVRTPEEFDEGHVPGAKNIPLDTLPTRVQELRSYKTVYVHCRSGGRAQRAFQFLQTQGLNNLVCIGETGMKDWTELGYPVEK